LIVLKTTTLTKINQQQDPSIKKSRSFGFFYFQHLALQLITAL